MPTRRCYECGGFTSNLDGECNRCKERDRREQEWGVEEEEDFTPPDTLGDFDDDVSAMEKRYENYIGRT